MADERLPWYLRGRGPIEGRAFWFRLVVYVGLSLWGIVLMALSTGWPALISTALTAVACLGSAVTSIVRRVVHRRQAVLRIGLDPAPTPSRDTAGATW